MRKAIAAFASSLGLLLALASPAGAAPAIDGHFPIPGGFDSNDKIAAGPDGNMWMTVDDATKDVARITPTGQVEEFELTGVTTPTGIAAGPDGKMWVTQEGGVASFSPGAPTATSVATPLPAVKAGSPIVAGPDSQMWVASKEVVLHFPPSNPAGAVELPVPGLTPLDIDVAGSELVIAAAGNGRLVLFTTAGTETTIALPDGSLTSQGVAGSPTGQIAFSKEGPKEGIAVLTPPGTPIVVEEMGGYGVARGSDGAYWFAMAFKEKIERMTPDGKATSLSGVPAGFFPRQIAAGPNNTIWATIEKPGEKYEVLRISGLEPPVTPPGTGEVKAPDTKIVKGPKSKVKTSKKKATVKFAFSSPTAGASFECALVTIKKGKKKAPKPKFKPCKSPKKLKLKPGKYRFNVRAVANGLTDPSPAQRAFRVVHKG